MPATVKTTPTPITRIVVAGDVSIDWLARTVPAVDAAPDSKVVLQNWQLREGTRMVALHGGALLLARMVGAATGPNPATGAPGATVATHVLSTEVEKVPPTEIIHSLVEVAPDDSMLDDDDDPVPWRIKRFAGFAGPDDGTPSILSVVDDDPAAGMVILDDVGNGYRDDPTVWPAALTGSGKPIVIYKTSRPLAQGPLWRLVSTKHAERLVVVVNAEDMRAGGARISRRLSWERTAKDVVWQLATNPDLLSLATCRHLIVRFGIDGALHYQAAEPPPTAAGQETTDGRKTTGRRKTANPAPDPFVAPPSTLYYDPAVIEGGFKARYSGAMQGYSAAFVAALARRVAADGLDAVGTAACEGVQCSRRLLLLGYGTNAEMLEYPGPPLFDAAGPRVPPLASVAVAHPTRDEAVSEPRYWSVLEERGKRRSDMEHMARNVVLYGPERSLRGIPTARFGKLEVVDRSEIESYRAIRNLIQRYLARDNPPRPLSIAVFGHPGSGKSFGVEQVARSLHNDKGGPTEKLEFNVAQWQSPVDLVRALHVARDVALAGKVPLVFFDEFDAPLEGGPAGGKLGWLKYFLAPMQDGQFKDGDVVHPIGRAIMVFCGGTSHSYQSFYVRPSGEPAPTDDRKWTPAQRARRAFVEAKGPDFVSRLRGYIDIKGPNTDLTGDNVVMVRRALILRRLIERVEPGLIDSNKVMRIDPGVLRALIRVPKYEHGVRSMEAILDMSQLAGRNRFEQAALPPADQLRLHVDAEEFAALLYSDPLPPAAREIVARAIHEAYVDHQLKTKGKPASHPSMKPWQELGDDFKFSNRHQADDIPRKLAAVSCGYEGGADPSTIDPFVFTTEDIDMLAPMEHDRWSVERRFLGWVLDRTLDQSDEDRKRTPYLVPWDELTPKVQGYDRAAMEALPATLARAGYVVYRLERMADGDEPTPPAHSEKGPC